MTSPRIVLDASAAVFLLSDPGERGARVAELLAPAALAAPSLLPYEVANVLRRHRLAGRLSLGQMQLALAGLSRLAVELWPCEALAGRAVELGDVLTVYDASYVTLAERLAAPLVTADKRLAGAAGVRCEIILV